ncbi:MULTISPECIES: hypothetical protein [Burkholderia]|uniref:hypothetical protein n=1 Tax=Burkholderia TaxID=32008 RepID=UPI00110EAE52|nr:MULTISPECIES: hypothetical protein [Burkholderia]MBR8216864.1 hypothetical protein [Burkholderia vietnamiensis]QDW49222.1 hypothetical protein FFI87_002075 [Burkholderia sp. KBS0801]HDR9012190.1 hypothetical protein [Burkholderia vietnamiensis]HDR9014849.1 hypothetical protein [Burkholderia vietnamiensis]HDR9108753.1 hypothetical protein [Burkholderia vietnamiensis]
MTYRWVSLLEPVNITSPTSLSFQGKTIDYVDPATSEIKNDGAAIGVALSDASFSGGTIKATFNFTPQVPKCGAGVIIGANAMTGAHLTAVLGLWGLCSLRTWTGSAMPGAGLSPGRWVEHATVGAPQNLLPEHHYELEVEMLGSFIKVRVDGVPVINFDVQESLTALRPGVWFMSQGNVDVTDFAVKSRLPSAFVVMEFSQAFNDLYAHVIKPVCASLNVSPVRADERHGPGIILADIERQIRESNVIIAEITPTNANVFYEVGYSHALKKPTILLAQRGTKLPFDVSGFRTIFYDNTIEGKEQVEAGLKKHLIEVFSRIG